MKLTAEDYRRNYAQMTDDEFLAINRDDLVEMARRAYDAELTQRQLTPPPVVEKSPPARWELLERGDEDDSDIPHEAPPFPPNEEAVQIAVIASARNARYALKYLHEANIPAFITENANVEGKYAEGCLGLHVPASCVEGARYLDGWLTWNNKELVRRWFLQDWTPEEMDLDDCEVKVDDYFGEENKFALRITVTGLDLRTKKHVKLSGMAIVHLANGKIGERWIHLDEAES